eukprot:CAMPEP_0170737940 /NCGR_PEP_ID=MMETSP0437-20130122/4390_1 /TAXON_ID=0 /ORGANISM="Sexangularia sp." /LENGTH=547 /DNA_ID=CAMNT_0011076351 /DNA_START=48 /DNA_END=1688 /DNA_ORIENTATION=+
MEGGQKRIIISRAANPAWLVSNRRLVCCLLVAIVVLACALRREATEADADVTFSHSTGRQSARFDAARVRSSARTFDAGTSRPVAHAWLPTTLLVRLPPSIDADGEIFVHARFGNLTEEVALNEWRETGRGYRSAAGSHGVHTSYPGGHAVTLGAGNGYAWWTRLHCIPGEPVDLHVCQVEHNRTLSLSLPLSTRAPVDPRLQNYTGNWLENFRPDIQDAKSGYIVQGDDRDDWWGPACHPEAGAVARLRLLCSACDSDSCPAPLLSLQPDGSDVVVAGKVDPMTAWLNADQTRADYPTTYLAARDRRASTQPTYPITFGAGDSIAELMFRNGDQQYGPLRFFRPMAYDRYAREKFRCEFFGWCPDGVRAGPVVPRDNISFVMTSYALWEVQSREWEEYARYLPKLLLAATAEIPDLGIGMILGWPTSKGSGQWRALARLRRLGAVAYAVSRHAKGCDDAVPIIGADDDDLAELRRRRPLVGVVDTFSFALGIIHTARDGRHIPGPLARQLAAVYHEEAAPHRRGHQSCDTTRVLWAEREFEAATRC